jgi:hypothetical protein
MKFTGNIQAKINIQKFYICNQCLIYLFRNLKIKNSCTSKDSSFKMKRQEGTWQKMLSNPILIKDCVQNLYSNQINQKLSTNGTL